MGTVDDILNTGIPLLLLLIVLGFIYSKLLKPLLIPALIDAYNWASGKKVEKAGVPEQPMGQKISYETL